MECACVYVDAESGLWDLHNAEMRTARKDYKCSECGEEIKRGSRYEYVRGKWDVYFETYRTCEICIDIRRVLFCNGYAYEFMIADLEAYIDELSGNVPEDCLAEMTTAARNVVCSMIEDYWAIRDDA